MTTDPLMSGGPMMLPFRPIRDADLSYAATVLVAFVERYDRNPEGLETLNDWWALPLPLHQRMGVLGGVAAAYPEHAPKVLRALQESALLAAEAALPVWNAACSNDFTLSTAVDAAYAYLEAPSRDGRAKVRRLSRLVLEVVEPTEGVAEDAGLTVYHALMTASPADDEALWMTVRSMTVAHECAKDAGADLTTASARLDTLVSELSPTPPSAEGLAGEEAPHHDD